MQLSMAYPPAPVASGYNFVGVDGAAALTGYFVNQEGLRTGASFSVAVPAAPAASIPLPNVPPDAVGVILRCSAGTCAYSPGDGDGDLSAHPGNYPTLPSSLSALGRVN